MKIKLGPFHYNSKMDLELQGPTMHQLQKDNYGVIFFKLLTFETTCILLARSLLKKIMVSPKFKMVHKMSSKSSVYILVQIILNKVQKKCTLQLIDQIKLSPYY